MLVLAQLTISVMAHIFGGSGPMRKTVNPSGDRDLEPGRGSFGGI